MLLAETKGRVWKHRDSNLSFSCSESLRTGIHRKITTPVTGNVTEVVILYRKLLGFPGSQSESRKRACSFSQISFKISSQSRFHKAELKF